MRKIGLGHTLCAAALVVGCVLGLEAYAQTSVPAADRDVQLLIDRVEGQVKRMQDATARRDKELEFLAEKVALATQLLSDRGSENESLRERNLEFGTRLEAVVGERDALDTRITAVLSQHEELVASLKAERDALLARTREANEHLAEQARTIGDKEALLGALSRKLDAAEKEEADTRRLAAEERAAALRRQDQLSALRNHLKLVEVTLRWSEKNSAAQKAEIADLALRLNRALAERVKELSKYRSEFLGRLREVLGNRPEMRAVGDRFVLQSEVLFESGSAQLGPGGRRQLERVAGVLKELDTLIPPDVEWILRVDGHTDKVPIDTEDFTSNWGLSTARAVTVVRVLVGRGIPPSRLAAAGFGEFQPIDDRDDEIAYRRNRRIEFKLTQR